MGLRPGDRYAILMRNDITYVEATLAGGALGAVPIPVNWHWASEELAYLLADSGSKLVFAHTSLLPALEPSLAHDTQVIEVGEPEFLTQAYQLPASRITGRYPHMEALIRDHLPLSTPITDPSWGVIYTSGTTGRPKGVLRRPVSAEDVGKLGELVCSTIGLAPGMRTAVTAPLYHAAPNMQMMFSVALGCDVEILPRFDAEGLLRLIEERRVAHVQMVPTMFHRLLRLPPDVRARYDLSSLRSVVHAAAPCPPDTKRAMIDWLGPIVLEYYGGSETGACVACTSEEWLAHPGTVGHPVGDADVKILAPGGSEVAAGQEGDIYLKPFPQWPDFTYIGNEAKRRDMESDGYLTLGDIGYLDGDGFLFLSDRRNDMVICGGVNVYPAEIEACIIGLDGVNDVAVFGIPDPEFGEALAAHVELAPNASIGAEDIRAHVAEHLAKYKVPKVVVFQEQLPRDESGKLFKRKLKDRYRPDSQTGTDPVVALPGLVSNRAANGAMEPAPDRLGTLKGRKDG
jgi:long-chain acyl-CoA synthetase